MLYIVQHLGGRLVRGKPRIKYLFFGRATDRGFGTVDGISAEPTYAGRIGSVFTEGGRLCYLRKEELVSQLQTIQIAIYPCLF